MTVLRINKFVDNDPINTTSDKQLHFNEHIILCFNLTKKSSKKKGKKTVNGYWLNQYNVGLRRYDFENICQMTWWKQRLDSLWNSCECVLVTSTWLIFAKGFLHPPPPQRKNSYNRI